LKVLSGKEFCKLLKARGWYLHRVKGSHHCYRHRGKRDLIVVPVHGNKDLKKGLQRKLMKQAEISEDML